MSEIEKIEIEKINLSLFFPFFPLGLVCILFFVMWSNIAFAVRMPVDFQPDNFGWRFMSYAKYNTNAGGVYYVFHPAADLNAENDNNGTTPVYAIADGTVVANDNGWGGIVIRHTFNGEYYYSQYGHIYHLNDESNLKVGKDVKEGDPIGYIGDVESKGVHHLHFEIRSPHHPDPNNAGYWGTSGGYINNRKKVFMAYESPLAFIRSRSEQNQTVIIIDDAVTYPEIESDIVNNKVQDKDGNVVKQNFFKAWNLSEWNTYLPDYIGDPII